MSDARIYLRGHADDLYMLSLLFPSGAYQGLHVVTAITGFKDGLFDRVRDATAGETYVTGEGVLPVLEALGAKEMDWVARQVIAPLNGYAVLVDPNFTPTTPLSVSWNKSGGSGGAVFGFENRVLPQRQIAATWTPKLAELLESRVDFMVENPLAAYAALVIGGTPSWADYYRLLEDIAGLRKTTLDKLAESGLAKPEPLKAFKKAANNRAFGRHGASKRDTHLSQRDLMNLLEAREFVRNVVSAWLDLECGGRMPHNRVDGGPLRFGLDDPG